MPLFIGQLFIGQREPKSPRPISTTIGCRPRCRFERPAAPDHKPARRFGCDGHDGGNGAGGARGGAGLPRPGGR